MARLARHDSAAPMSALVWLALATALAGGGCVQVPVWKQGRVSGPGLVFSDSAVLAARPNLIGQIEPGSAISGGAQAAGCTACR